MRSTCVTPLSKHLHNPNIQFRLAAMICAAVMLCSLTWAQNAATPAVASHSLITQPIDETQLTTLKGNTYPLAQRIYDVGAAPATLPMERMLLVLKRSPQQEYALRTLLDNQQDKHSASYHKWLTPEQFGKQFGPSDSDIATITAWLQSHGFQVGTTKGRTVLEFSGSASQVREAFHTTIHKFVVNGEQHWANVSDPQIPTALTPAVAGVLSLHNFRAKAFHYDLGVFTRSKATGMVKPLKGLYTFPSGNNGCGVQGSPCYAVGPYDFATIYDVLPLWNTTPTAIDGTGQTIAIVGETEINSQDVTDFRNFFGMSQPNLQMINDGPSPGIVSDETEADLDVQWSGAVAKGATIDFVISATTNSTFGVALSAQYIVDNNLAPVMSMSYGLCELATGTAGNQFYNQLWQQASAQGITAIVSAGDSGAAGCDNHDANPPNPAEFGLAVTGWGDSPYNVSVGGTDFFDLTDQSTYWNPTNATTTQASAISYIPEATWNDSCTNSVFGDLLGFSTNAETNCNNSQLVDFVVTVGGSGGASNCTTNDGQTVASCSGGYPKPSWQPGTDGLRDIPDVSLFAAAGSPSGSFYIICQEDQVTSGTSCDPNDPNTQFFGVGGTSASAPAFAGIMALVNQITGERQGNANYVLYPMATQVPTAFHDVTTGTIRMPCASGSPDCTTSTNSDAYGVLSDYDAGTGYDLATGLGSVDANVLVSNWSSIAGSFTPTTTTLTLNGNTSAINITHGTAVTVAITVRPNSGTGTPAGSVSLIATGSGNTAPTQSGLAGFTLSNGSFSGSFSALPGGGPYSVTAHYSGNTTTTPASMFAASSSASPGISVKVTPESSTTALTLIGTDLNGNLLTSPFPFGSLIFVRADVTGASRQGIPTGKVSFTDTFGSLPAQNPQISPAVAITNPVGLNSQGNTSIGAGIVSFDAGNHSISASYTGDASFSVSNSTQSVGFTVQPGIAALFGLASVTIASPGQSGSTSVGFIASSNITGNVTFSCSSGLPTGASCTSTPVATGGPATVATATINVTTTAPTAKAQSKQRTRYFVAMMGGLPLAGIFLIAVPRRRRASLLLGLMVLAMLVTIPACGGGGNSSGGGGGGGGGGSTGTPAGTYTVTVTGTAGSTSGTVGQFTLIVQ